MSIPVVFFRCIRADHAVYACGLTDVIPDDVVVDRMLCCFVAGVDPALARPYVGNITSPNLIGPVHCELPIQTVRNFQVPLIRFPVIAHLPGKFTICSLSERI